MSEDLCDASTDRERIRKYADAIQNTCHDIFYNIAEAELQTDPDARKTLMLSVLLQVKEISSNALGIFIHNEPDKS